MMKDADKLIQYVKKGSLHKVKRCIRKWKKEGKSILNVKTGSGRTLLHLACYHGDDAICRVLLRTGCDANCHDKDGNTPIHLALDHVLRGHTHLLCDLIEPVLVKAMSSDVLHTQRNHMGYTPADLLSQARKYVAEQKKPSSDISWDDDDHVDRDWNDKLSSEWAYENNQMDDDSYFRSFNGENHRKETYDDWAQRMSFEYNQKHNYTKPHRGKSTKPTAAKENEKLLKDLQREHEKYLRKQQKKSKYELKRKKEEYLELSNTFFSNDSNEDSTCIGYDDIPWPGHMTSVEEMLNVLQHGVAPSSLKKFVFSQLKFWHPDKFQQKFGHRLSADESECIITKVKELSQGLNKLIEINNS